MTPIKERVETTNIGGAYTTLGKKLNFFLMFLLITEYIYIYFFSGTPILKRIKKRHLLDLWMAINSSL